MCLKNWEDAMDENKKLRRAGWDSQLFEHELEDEIRKRAYDLYCNRGKKDGHALDDWLTAEAEVRARGQFRDSYKRPA
jgi:Protein of unknown function (DUF2934)